MKLNHAAGYLLLALFAVSAVATLPTHAQQNDPLCRDLEVPLPNLDGGNYETVCDFIPPDVEAGQVQQALTPFVNTIAIYAIVITIIAGLIVVVVAGYIYMTAGGDASRVNFAKTLIMSAIIGIVIALGYFVILYTINPGIVGR